MALPTLWTQKIFRPFGDTSPISLTAHLPPEEDAKVLCLTCSDLRHVLYTIYSRSASSEHLWFEPTARRLMPFSPT